MSKTFIREMVSTDHPALLDLFRETPGITLREADSQEATKRYLQRNPGLNFVIEHDAGIVGCVMCGHDGRRGYLQHLIVKPEFRRQGLGEDLVNRCISSLKELGIDKTHIFVFKNNGLANRFWQSKGWSLREGVNLYSYTASGNENA
ncbi:GNAT family N-acetyltransferase [Kiloniella laminariae]|uniref:GNAT family N-acetyltransferase n=1 Tax=Kiloniella laminariae TaxID=454162 RepID=A0ABT4LN20_9PROT|nr:GNAT family N-acetyltransferase [Kiloniella laminariae]MCZ4282533.1 GNAT family N-acetyltransferase [Kiloniella laminariae]